MPSVSSQSPTITQYFLNQITSGFLAIPAAGLLTGGEIQLFTAGPTPITPNSVAGDFTECTFDGYAAVTYASAAGVNLPSGDGWGQMKGGTFVCTGSTTPENVAGYLLVDGGGALVLAEYFDAPIPITVLGDFIDLALFVPLGFSVDVT